MNITIPKLSPRRPDRPQRVGQEHVRPQALPARPRSSRRTPAGGWSATTRTTRPSRTMRSRCCTSSPRKRLALGRLTVVDATNVQPEARKPLVELARKYHCLPVAIVLNLPERALPGAEPGPGRPGLRPARRPQPAVATAAVAPGAAARRASATSSCWRRPRRSRRRPSSGCRSGTTSGTSTARSTSSATFTAAATSWRQLLERLGYADGIAWTRRSALGRPGLRPPRGPQGRLRRRPGGPWAAHPRHGAARAEHGRRRLGPVRARQPRHEAAARSSGARTCRSRTGWPNTLAEIDALPDDVRDAVPQGAGRVPRRPGEPLRPRRRQARRRPRRDEGRRCRAGARARCGTSPCTARRPARPTSSACPSGYNWAAEYRGPAMVVYGHTPVPEPEWLNRTVNIDTGCVFGGKLTALRYPEQEFVSVPAARTYCEPARPFLPGRPAGPEAHGAAGPRRRARRRGRAGQADRLDPAAGQRHDPGGERHGGAGGDEPVRRQSEVADLPAAHDVAVRDEQRAGAAGASGRGVRLLPQPGCPAGRLRREAHGVAGRRRSSAGTRQAARERFGVVDGEVGIVYTRTGRRFFNDPELERQFLDRVRAALTAADLWDELDTTWVCLDCELMPWSAKAQELLRTQYAAVGAAGPASLPRAVAVAGAGRRAAGRRGAGASSTQVDGRLPPPGAGHRPVRRRLPAVLLAGGVADRPEAGPVPPAGHRGARPHGQGPRLAHGDAGRRSAGPTRNCCWRRRTRSWT